MALTTCLQSALWRTWRQDAGDSLFFSLVRALADTKTLACGKNYRSFRAEDPYKRKMYYPVEQRAALVPKQYFHGTPQGTVGPIEAKLLEYGALDGPDAHAVVGLVLGAFGWTASTTLFCPPAIPRAVRSTRTRSRTNTTVSSFQTTDTVLPMLPALAGATAAKVLVCFCIMLFVKFPPWGARKTLNGCEILQGGSILDWNKLINFLTSKSPCSVVVYRQPFIR